MTYVHPNILIKKMVEVRLLVTTQRVRRGQRFVVYATIKTKIKAHSHSLIVGFKPKPYHELNEKCCNSGAKISKVQLIALL